MKSISKRLCAFAMAMALCLSVSSVAFAADYDATSENVAATEQSAARAGTVIASYNLVSNPGQKVSKTFNLSGYSSYRFELTFYGTGNDAATVDQKLPNGREQTVVTMSNSLKSYSYTSTVSGSHTLYSTNWRSSQNVTTVFVVIYGI